MRTLVPLLPIMALSGLLSAIHIASIIRVGTPANGRLLETAPALFLLTWVIRDAHRRRCIPCHEFGFLVAAYMPISFVWYLFWSRGWKGFWLLGAFVGLLVLPGIASVVAYIILTQD